MKAGVFAALLALLCALSGTAQEPSTRDATRDAMEELLAAGGDPTLRIELVLRGEAALGSVTFGAPFALDVIRRWPVGEEAAAWSDESLAPLVVEQTSLERGTEQSQVVETRSFRAHAFRLGAVTLRPEFGLVVDEGREPRRGIAPLTTLMVDSSLPADDDGAIELPPAPVLCIEPVRRVLATAALLALAAGGVAWILCRLWIGWRASGAADADRPRTPAERIAALAAVSEQDLAQFDRAAWRADALEWSAILDELQLRAGSTEPTAALADLAEELDQVKFAGARMRHARRAELLAETARFERAIAAASHAAEAAQ